MHCGDAVAEDGRRGKRWGFLDRPAATNQARHIMKQFLISLLHALDAVCI
jgi:hypothetical protein